MTTIYNSRYDINGKAAGDRSGNSVSMNSTGDIVAIGAEKNNGNGIESGHVRVYKRVGDIWQKLGDDIHGETANDESGISVSMNNIGNTVAIGAQYNDGTGVDGSKSGHVRVWKYMYGPDNPSTKKWIKLGDDIDGENPGDQSGASVSINNAGDIVAIGATRNTDENGVKSGHVRVHQYNLSTKLWERLGKDIDGEGDSDNSGSSVSMNSAGNIVAIGAVRNTANAVDGSYYGHVRVWEYKDGTWQKLGQDIDGEAKNDFSGVSVSMNSAGDIVAIGAKNNDGVNGTQSGHVRVWEYKDGTWQKLGQDIDGESKNDFSGSSVSMNSAGNIVAIGVQNNSDNGNSSGHARIWKYMDDPDNLSVKKWIQLGLDIDGETAGDYSGKAISMNNAGTIVAISAHYHSYVDGDNDQSGYVRVFYYRNGIWNQVPPGFFKVSNGFFKLSGNSFFKV